MVSTSNAMRSTTRRIPTTDTVRTPATRLVEMMATKSFSDSALTQISASTEAAGTSRIRGSSAARLRDPRPYLELCVRVDTVVALVVLVLIFLLFNVHKEPRGFKDFLEMRLTMKNVLVLALFAVLWRLLFTWCGAYNWSKIRRRDVEALRILAACNIGSVVAILFPLTSTGGGFPVISLVCFGTVSYTHLTLPTNREV